MQITPTIDQVTFEFAGLPFLVKCSWLPADPPHGDDPGSSEEFEVLEISLAFEAHSKSGNWKSSQMAYLKLDDLLAQLGVDETPINTAAYAALQEQLNAAQED